MVTFSTSSFPNLYERREMKGSRRFSRGAATVQASRLAAVAQISRLRCMPACETPCSCRRLLLFCSSQDITQEDKRAVVSECRALVAVGEGVNAKDGSLHSSHVQNLKTDAAGGACSTQAIGNSLIAQASMTSLVFVRP